MSKVACIIPARMGSSRFPGKPIAKMCGYPMIEHVYRRVKIAETIDEVYVATCDEEIAQVAESIGAKAIMTSPDHVRGTDRVAEAAEKLDADIIINVQGDEPMVDPQSLDDAINLLRNNSTIQCVNLVAPITDWDVFIDPNVVKTVATPKNKVLYFSRLPVPTTKREDFSVGLKQIGIYVFRKDLLSSFLKWDETPLEIKESVDMMRILENDIEIFSSMAKDTLSVDTLEDLAAVEQVLLKDSLFQKLFQQQNSL